MPSLYAKVVALMQSDEAQNARIQQLENEVAALRAAGTSSSGDAPEAPAGSSASEASDADDNSIAPNDDDPATAATFTVEISLQANDNEPVAADESAQEVQEATPEPANDNDPPAQLPATGTEQSAQRRAPRTSSLPRSVSYRSFRLRDPNLQNP